MGRQFMFHIKKWTCSFSVSHVFNILCINSYLQPTDNLSKGGKPKFVQTTVVGVVDEQLALKNFASWVMIISGNNACLVLPYVISVKLSHLTGSCIRPVGGIADCPPRVAPHHWVVLHHAVQPFLIHWGIAWVEAPSAEIVYIVWCSYKPEIPNCRTKSGTTLKKALWL